MSELSRPITDEDRQELLEPVDTAMKEVLGLGWELLKDRPNFIASTDDRSPLGTVVRSLSQFNCRRWAAADKSNFSTRVNSGNAELCGPYLDSLGESPDDGSIAPPFVGGQCVGATYRVTGTHIRSVVLCNGTPIVTGVTGTYTSGYVLTGPIVSIETYSVNGACSSTKPNIYGVRVVHNGGLSTTNLQINSTGTDRYFTNFSVSVQPQILSGTDNCGNPDSEITPPTGPTPAPTPPTEITVNLPGYGPVDVTLTLDDDGDPVFCVEQLDTCFTVDIFGDAGGGGEPAPTPGDQGQPGDAVDINDDEAADITDENKILVGALVQVISTPPRVNKVFNKTEVYTKGAYFVYFGGDVGLSLNPEGAITIQDQFFYAPEGANRVRVVPNNGFSLRVIPYYREA